MEDTGLNWRVKWHIPAAWARRNWKLLSHFCSSWSGIQNSVEQTSDRVASSPNSRMAAIARLILGPAPPRAVCWYYKQWWDAVGSRARCWRRLKVRQQAQKKTGSGRPDYDWFPGVMNTRTPALIPFVSTSGKSVGESFGQRIRAKILMIKKRHLVVDPLYFFLTHALQSKCHGRPRTALWCFWHNIALLQLQNP